MNTVNYIVFAKYRWGFEYLYRFFKRIVRYSSWYHTHTGSFLEGLRLRAAMKTDGNVIDKTDIARYKKKWGVLSSKVPALFMNVYPAFSRVKSDDYVPDTLYFTHIEPMLNNVEYSRSFADKNMYTRLIDKEVQPLVLLRKMHGMYLDHNYKAVPNVDSLLAEIAREQGKMVLKHSISSQGGKNISILKNDGTQFLINGVPVNHQWLEKYTGDNFLLQSFVRQHPFYEQFNPSSLNTLRVFTYRSVKDDKVHVLHSVLRVGKDGSEVDNISMGGKACGITQDGFLNGVICDINAQLYKEIGQVDLKNNVGLFKYNEVVQQAINVAKTQFYSRIIGFDFCVDDQERVKLIELNNYDIGVDILQQCNGPLFREFTDEIIEYCKKKKKKFRYIIR